MPVVDLTKPPEYVESGGGRVPVRSVRVMLLKRDPRLETDAEATMGFGRGVRQWYYNRRLDHWWDTHESKTKDKPDTNRDRYRVTDDNVMAAIRDEFERNPRLFAAVQLELGWFDKRSVENADDDDETPAERANDDAFMLAAVRNQPVTVNPSSSMSGLPFEHSRFEMMVWCVLAPRQLAQLISDGKPARRAAPKAKPKTGLVFDPSRPCGTRVRAANRYTREELERVAREGYGIDPEGKTMDQLCAALKRRVK